MNQKKKKKKMANVKIRTNRPTELSFEDLYTWVIWQFPRRKGAGLCGAVRPPIAKHSWYPALIKHHEKQIQVYGHLEQEFSTPVAAADWIENHG